MGGEVDAMQLPSLPPRHRYQFEWLTKVSRRRSAARSFWILVKVGGLRCIVSWIACYFLELSFTGFDSFT